jgi:hypothetical protein
MRTQVEIGLGRLLLVVLTAWSLAMIGPDIYRLYDPLGSFGLSLDNDGVVLDVVAPFHTSAASPAALAGINPGDRVDITAMRCLPRGNRLCSALLRLLGGLGGLQLAVPGQHIELVIDPAGTGPPRRVSLTAAHAPLAFAARLVLLADSLVGVAVVVAAFWLVWRRPSRMTWGFFLYAMWFNPGQDFVYYALLQRWPTGVLLQEIAESMAYGGALAGLLMFALSFPDDKADPGWRSAERALPALGVGIAIVTLPRYGSALGFPTETLARATFFIGYVVDVVVVVILVARLKGLPPQDRQRMRWVICGCVIGLPAYLFAAIAQSSGLVASSLGVEVAPIIIGLLYLLNGVLAYFVAEAVSNRRVVSVAIPLRHGTILAMLTLTAGVPIVYLHELTSHYQEELHLPEWIWPFFVAPIVLVLLQRLHEIAVHLFDSVLNHNYHRQRRLLQAAEHAMLDVTVATDIDRLLVEAPVQALDLSSGAVFRSEQGTFRRTGAAPGWEAPMDTELHPKRDGIVLESLDKGEPVRLPHWVRPGIPSGLEAPCLSVPILSGVLERIAVVLLGPHKAGTDINADEREMLRRLAERAAAAYERAEIVRLREEVTKLQAQLASEWPALGAGAPGQ